MDNKKLSLENICQGALPEVFHRSIESIIENIRDPNTDAEAKRTLTLEFVFTPHADRSGADVTLKTKEKLAGLQSVKGAIFVSRMDGKLAAYPNDPRQELLFTSVEDRGTTQ